MPLILCKNIHISSTSLTAVPTYSTVRSVNHTTKVTELASRKHRSADEGPIGSYGSTVDGDGGRVARFGLSTPD